MAAKSGLSHHLKGESAKKKKNFLTAIANGMTVNAAAEVAGVKSDTVKYWVNNLNQITGATSLELDYFNYMYSMKKRNLTTPTTCGFKYSDITLVNQ